MNNIFMLRMWTQRISQNLDLELSNLCSLTFCLSERNPVYCALPARTFRAFRHLFCIIFCCFFVHVRCLDCAYCATSSVPFCNSTQTKNPERSFITLLLARYIIAWLAVVSFVGACKLQPNQTKRWSWFDSSSLRHFFFSYDFTWWQW